MQALDGKKEGRAGHFRGGDSKGDNLGGPDGLLHEDLVVDLAQAVYKEGGGKAFTGPRSFLSYILPTLLGYEQFEFFFFYRRCHTIVL